MKNSYRDLSKEELLKKKNELVKEHFDLRVNRVMGNEKNSVKLRVLRRDIARINTRLTELEMKNS